MKMKIKKGDMVMVMTGQDRSKTGKVIKVFPGIGRLVVEGVNLRKRREKTKKAGKPGQVIEAPAPFAAAKAMIMCPHCGRGRRLGYRLARLPDGQETGKKLRLCRQCGYELKS